MNPATVQALLDPETARPMLARVLPSAAASSLHLESAWIKPGRHFNVCYRVGDRSNPALASLCIVRAGEGERVRSRAGLDANSGLRRAEMAGDDVLAQLFPFDYRVEGLASCLEAKTVAPLLGKVDACTVAAYRAGMRCQVRYSMRGVVKAYGKVAVDRQPGRRARVHAQLADAAGTTLLRVPPALGEVTPPGLFLVEAVQGTSLHETLAAAPNSLAVATTADALREIHERLPPPADRVHTAADELALLGTWAAWMAQVDPALDGDIRRVLAMLEATRPASAPTTFAHRDFHDKQVLASGERRWLLDVDTACTGDRELDLGNFLAQLFLRGLQWKRRDPHRELEFVAEEAYGPDARRRATRWYRRATLLRLACSYRFRPRWRDLTPDLFAEAARP